MKKINKTPGPNPLTAYAEDNPDGNWDDGFRNHNGGEDYQTVRRLILEDQGGLCAYCETGLKELPPHKQRVEHFHPKSDKSNPGKNWALDWKNILGVCIGGDDSDKETHPLPQNLSCDSHKNHLANKGKLPEPCEGWLINPLSIVASPCLFDLDKRTGELIPYGDACENVEIEGNQTESTQAMVQKTIDILNLNCDRLNQQRIKVLNAYNSQIKEARKNNDKRCFSKMAKRWFREKWPSFFTTRRILLGKHAETYLEQIGFQG